MRVNLVNSCKLYKLNSIIKLLALLPRLHFDFREVQPRDSCLLWTGGQHWGISVTPQVGSVSVEIEVGVIISSRHSYIARAWLIWAPQILPSSQYVFQYVSKRLEFCSCPLISMVHLWSCARVDIQGERRWEETWAVLGEACEENGKCIAMLISPTTPVT